ncbi:MAG: stage V sporulation protein AD [Lachnospiraceae bacterium]|nr:stage V sporulation protein AD [Lachnospiraceae bacterium]
MIKGLQSICFDEPPYVQTGAAIVGKKEGEGPLGERFDEIEEDPMFGKESWEEAESELQRRTANKAIEKSGLSKNNIRYIFAGDLLGQETATSFGVKDLNIPLFGLYGACSTMGEAMSLGAICVAGGFAGNVLAMASSHFASAEKEFRFPLEYGNQRAMSAQWTVTGAGAVIIGKTATNVRIAGITTGKIVDMGVKDSMNMGACMAPAACDTIYQHFKDFERSIDDYDMVITGDLGYVGKELLLELLKQKGMDISEKYTDCGIEMFDKETQDTHAGGSGCGCSASVLCAYYLDEIAKGNYKRILFVPTGALLSKVSFNEGRTIPSIAHAVVLEHCE